MDAPFEKTEISGVANIVKPEAPKPDPNKWHRDVDKSADASGCPACGKDVKPGNKYCSWECGSQANRFKKELAEIVKSAFTKSAGPCQNASCPQYGQEHANCQCYGAGEEMQGLAKSLREIAQGRTETARQGTNAISKDGGQWAPVLGEISKTSGAVPVIGPRGAPAMMDPKTHQLSYGHNAERMAHIREFGDLRFDDEGQSTETSGKTETNHQTSDYTRVKDLTKPHGHSEPTTPIDLPHNKPQPIQAKAADLGGMPNNPIAPATAGEGFSKAMALNTLSSITSGGES